MKRMNFLFLCGIIGMASLSSCENDLESDDFQNHKISLESEEITSENLKVLSLKSALVKVLYKGKMYYSKMDTIKGCAVFTDSIVQNIERKISKLPNSGTLIYPDGSVEFFDSEEDFQKNSMSILNRSKSLMNRFTLANFNEDIMLTGGDHMLSGPMDVTNNCVELYFYSKDSGLGSEIALAWDRNYEDKVITRNVSGKMKSFVFFSMRTVRYLFCYDQNNNKGQWFTIFANLNGEMNGVKYAESALLSMTNIHTGLPMTSILNGNYQNWNDRVQSIKISSFMGDY